jgi:hypothetical protein
VAGQCGVNAKTGCPVDGPLIVSPPAICVGLGSSLVTIATQGSGGGCVTNDYVQVAVPKGISSYEAVWYSTIGLGTRWWSSPGTVGPASVTGEGAKYRVPNGFAAWSAAGGAQGSGPCPTGPPAGTHGTAGWGEVDPILADACDEIQAQMQLELQQEIQNIIRNGGTISFLLTPPGPGLLETTIAFEGTGGSGSSIAGDPGTARAASGSGCTDTFAFDGGGSSGSSVAADVAAAGPRADAAATGRIIGRLSKRLAHRRYKLTVRLNKTGRKLLRTLAAADRAYFAKHPGGSNPPHDKIKINVHFS